MLQELAHSEHQATRRSRTRRAGWSRPRSSPAWASSSPGVAHEINNPLAFVSNNVAVLERDLRDLLGLIGLYRQGEQDRWARPGPT